MRIADVSSAFLDFEPLHVLVTAVGGACEALSGERGQCLSGICLLQLQLLPLCLLLGIQPLDMILYLEV
jgi:hypothetical protein